MPKTKIDMSKHKDGSHWGYMNPALPIAMALLVFSLLKPSSALSLHSIQAFTFQDKTFVAYEISTTAFDPQIYTASQNSPPLPPDLPLSWDVRNALQTDLTGDGIPEITILVWRPWRDLPYMRWSKGPSPIADSHDENGDSCHVILIEPNPEDTKASDRPHKSYREIWAGSALPVPLVRIAAGDVDGDDVEELVALEGDYATGRDGPGERISVWQWNGFGFTMEWESEEGIFEGLALLDVNEDAICDIITW